MSVFAHGKGGLCVAKGDLHHVYACRKVQLCVQYWSISISTCVCMHLVIEGLSGGEITWHYNEIHHTLPLILLIEI